MVQGGNRVPGHLSVAPELGAPGGASGPCTWRHCRGPCRRGQLEALCPLRLLPAGRSVGREPSSCPVPCLSTKPSPAGPLGGPALKGKRQSSRWPSCPVPKGKGGQGNSKPLPHPAQEVRSGARHSDKVGWAPCPPPTEGLPTHCPRGDGPGQGPSREDHSPCALPLHAH